MAIATIMATTIVKGIDDTYRNSVFQFSLGYKIPLSN